MYEREGRVVLTKTKVGTRVRDRTKMTMKEEAEIDM